MTTKDNPPAFPRDHRHLGHNGMNLRDWFAGQVLPSALVGATNLDTMSPDERKRIWAGVAGIMYEVADAMLEERAK